jgi:hypothetical protein
MRRSLWTVVIDALGILCTQAWSYAESDASAANKKQEVRAADSSQSSAGFVGGDWSSSGAENNLSLTANRHIPRTCNDPRGGRRSAVDCWIEERG